MRGPTWLFAVITGKMLFYATVWKFQNFSVIQILRETNFEGSRSCESANFPSYGL